MKLRLSSDFAIDTDDYKREGLRLSILAMSGHGKSNAAADVVEDVLDNHAQVIIVEPIPEWHTLKARYNNVVVIGGPYQDLPLEPGFAHEYVMAALEKGISLVVNVSDIEDDTEQLHFVSSFLWNLYRLEQKYRRVLFLVLEEADIWAPQMWDQASKQSLSRVSLIAKHGRKIGIFPILISQRPADLHKSPLSQCNINLFGKFSSPADLDTKTGVMYVVKKLHLPIDEQQIMTLPTGHFIVSDKNGVHTVAVRKRLCPHGADTPLIEAKPFTADLSHALGNLREEITKALEARKEQQSEIKRLEKERDQLKVLVKQLEEKANIKLSVKEMLENDAPAATLTLSKEDKDSKEKLENRIQLLENMKKDLEKHVNDQAEKLKLYDELKSVFRQMFPKGIPENPFLTTSKELKTAGLQQVTKIVDVAEVKKSVGIFPTDTAKGKIVYLAKEGFFSTWRTLGEVNKRLTERAWTVSSQQVNNALAELVDAGILGVQHTDRNQYKLAPDVVFDGKSP